MPQRQEDSFRCTKPPVKRFKTFLTHSNSELNGIYFTTPRAQQ